MMLGNKLKELRKSKGFSQEELAYKCGLSLRTIQRIENCESEPRGDTLRRISNELGFNSNDVYDWGLREDKSILKSLNYSSLCFLVFPLLGIIIPFILWTSNKSRIKGIDALGKSILNYQISWCLFYFFLLILFSITLFFSVIHDWLSLKELTTFYWFTPVIIMVFMYGHNLRTIYINSICINKDKEVKYNPKFLFLK